MQLTIGNITDFVDKCRSQGYSEETIKQMSIYLGNDEELNYVHGGYYIDLVDTNNPKAHTFVDVIQDYDPDYTGSCVLIS